MNTCTPTHTYVHIVQPTMFIVCMYIHVCIYIYRYVCMYVYVRMYVYVHMQVYNQVYKHSDTMLNIFICAWLIWISVKYFIASLICLKSRGFTCSCFYVNVFYWCRAKSQTAVEEYRAKLDVKETELKECQETIERLGER